MNVTFNRSMMTSKTGDINIRKKKTQSFISKLGLFDRYNLAFILMSIIPLAALSYVILVYVSPMLIGLGTGQAEQTVIWLKILVLLLVFLAILGFFISRAATRETVDKVNRYNCRLQKLFEISYALSQQEHLDILLHNIVKTAIEMTGASAGIVLLRDQEEKDSLKFEVSIGTGSISVKEIPIGDGIAGWVAENSKTVWINEVEMDERYKKDMDILENFNTSSIVASPLGNSTVNYGVLELLHRKEDNLDFTQEDANILRSLAGQASIFIQNVKFRQDQQNYFTHITEILISSLERTPQFWPGHLKNTAQYSYLIGRKLGLNDFEMKSLHYAALLHDIGFVKLGLREKLSRKSIELHPEIGYDMIHPIDMWKEVAPLIKHHHERFDGSGYPNKLKGDDIPLGSRILAVAETFDVVTNKHSYRREILNEDQAMKEIQAYAGTQFDPKIVDILNVVVEQMKN